MIVCGGAGFTKSASPLTATIAASANPITATAFGVSHPGLPAHLVDLRPLGALLVGLARHGAAQGRRHAMALT